MNTNWISFHYTIVLNLLNDLQITHFLTSLSQDSGRIEEQKQADIMSQKMLIFISSQITKKCQLILQHCEPEQSYNHILALEVIMKMHALVSKMKQFDKCASFVCRNNWNGCQIVIYLINNFKILGGQKTWITCYVLLALFNFESRLCFFWVFLDLS